MVDNSEADYQFDLERFFPDYIFDRITQIRVDVPEVIEKESDERRRRTNVAGERGKLTMLVADGVTPRTMMIGDRQAYLGRILRILTATTFDGVMSTPDLIEDLMIVDHLVKEGGGPSFLDDRVLIGCMQTGMAGDRFTAYTAESIEYFRLDGGKMVLSLVLDDERTSNTLDDCSQAVSALNAHELPSFLEPLWSGSADDRVDELVMQVNALAGLGDSSRYTWLVLPYCEDYRRVTQATTLPILVRSTLSNGEMIQQLAAALSGRANVRGVIVGSEVIFPGTDDPAMMANAIHELVHNNASVDSVHQLAANHRETEIDFLTRYIQQDMDLA